MKLVKVNEAGQFEGLRLILLFKAMHPFVISEFKDTANWLLFDTDGTHMHTISAYAISILTQEDIIESSVDNWLSTWSSWSSWDNSCSGITFGPNGLVSNIPTKSARVCQLTIYIALVQQMKTTGLKQKHALVHVASLRPKTKIAYKWKG